MPLPATAPKNACACSTPCGRSRASKHVALEAGATGASRHVARRSIGTALRGPTWAQGEPASTAFYAYAQLAYLVACTA